MEYINHFTPRKSKTVPKLKIVNPSVTQNIQSTIISPILESSKNKLDEDSAAVDEDSAAVDEDSEAVDEDSAAVDEDSAAVDEDSEAVE